MRDGAALEHLAVAAHRDRGRCRARALILDPERDRLLLADDAEARRGDQHDAAVALVRAAGDQRMHGRREAERRGSAGTSWTRPSVIRMAPATRSGGTSARPAASAANSRVPSVSPSACAGLDDAHLEIRECGRAARSAPRAPLRSAAGAFAEALARALVDHDRGDRGQRIAVLAGEATDWRAPAPRSASATGAHQRAAAAHRAAAAPTTTTATATAAHSTRRGTSGANAIPKFHRVLLLAQPLEQRRARAPGRPCSCRSACTSRC